MPHNRIFALSIFTSIYESAINLCCHYILLPSFLHVAQFTCPLLKSIISTSFAVIMSSSIVVINSSSAANTSSCTAILLCLDALLLLQTLLLTLLHALPSCFTLYIAASCTPILPRFDLVKKSFENAMQKNYREKKALKALSS